MVKISFQSVAGQKVEKENDGDKSEILIPHQTVGGVSSFCSLPGPAVRPFVFSGGVVVVVVAAAAAVVVVVVFPPLANTLPCVASPLQTCTCTVMNSSRKRKTRRLADI